MRTITVEEVKKGVELRNVKVEGKADSLGVRAVYRCDLTDLDLNGADLSDTMFLGVDFSGTDLTGANLNGSDFLECNLRGVRANRANFRGATIHKCDVSGASMSIANLSDVLFCSSDAYKAVFFCSDFSGSNLRKVNFVGACLAGADFSNVSLGELTLHDTDMEGARLSGSMDDKVDIPITMTSFGGGQGGHGGADYKMVSDFIKCILEDKAPKLDVDFAIKISLPGVIAAQSIENGGNNLEIPEI